MNIHTAIHDRIDVLRIWCASMRAFAASGVRLHVWYSGPQPDCGDVAHPMPHVGIGAAAWVVSRLPRDELRVFVESDIIAVRPWSILDYPGEARMLEGCPGKRWHGLTIASPGASLTADIGLIPQRYVRDGGCPEWMPGHLREPAVAANAKIVGDHWLHIDKVHRNIPGVQQSKAELLAALSSWLPSHGHPPHAAEKEVGGSAKCLFDWKGSGWECWTCGKVIARGQHDQPTAFCDAPYRGDIPERVGDRLHATFEWLGIKPKEGCGCAETQQTLNRRGAAWSQDNMEWIVGRLKMEAKDRGLPFVEAGARFLIAMAIKGAVDDANKKAKPH